MAESVGVPLKEKTSQYRYTAFTAGERLVKGTIAATSEAMAQHMLTEKGYQPVSLVLVPSRLSMEQLFPTLFAIKPREVIVFSRQLATLLESGVSLLPALELLQGQLSAGKGFKRVLSTMLDDLRTGKSFSQAVGAHPRVFSQIYSRTIAVGERTGRLEYTLKQLADYQEKQGLLTKKLTSALTYPSMVLGIAGVVSFVLITVALPPLMGMFENMNVPLPITTRLLMALSNFTAAYKLPMFITLITLVICLAWYIKQPQGRRVLDRLRLTVPLMGTPLRMGELGRICRTISVLLSAGVPLQEIMEILPQTSTNSVVRDALFKVHQGLLLGEGLGGPMAKDELFPPLMVQMVMVGEESNTLVSTLAVVANFYDITAEERLSALVGMISPISTIFIALVAGFIALSVIMPIYQITGSL